MTVSGGHTAVRQIAGGTSAAVRTQPKAHWRSRRLLPVWGRFRSAFDATGVLSLFLVLLLVLPSRASVGALGAAGRPAFLLGLGGLGWWLTSRIISRYSTRGRQPLRAVVFVWVLVTVIGYASGAVRALPENEARSADRFVIVQLALAGVALLAMDGINDRRRLDALLRRLVYLGLFLAVVGTLQFRFKYDLVPKLVPPGLSLNLPLLEVGSRNGTDLLRVTGTTGHYIEFGVVVIMVLPVAMHLAMFATTTWRRRGWWAASIFLAVASSFSLSRSATLGLVLVLLVVVMSWRPRRQWRAAVVAVLAVGASRALVPGLVGTIRGLVTNAGQDDSIDGRTKDYAEVRRLISERPFFGRGSGTFIPENYFFLDNQLLLTLIEGGVIGLAGLLVVFGVPYAMARSVRFGPGDEQTRHLGQCLAASVVVGFAVCGTFDAFSFLTYAGLLFFMIGLIGALWRLQREPSPTGGPDEPVMLPRTRMARVLPDLPRGQRPARPRNTLT